MSFKLKSQFETFIEEGKSRIYGLNEKNFKVSVAEIQNDMDSWLQKIKDAKDRCENDEDKKTYRDMKNSMKGMKNLFRNKMMLVRRDMERELLLLDADTSGTETPPNPSFASRHHVEHLNLTKQDRRAIQLTENLKRIGNMMVEQVDQGQSILEELDDQDKIIDELNDRFDGLEHVIHKGRKFTSQLTRKEKYNRILTYLSFVFFIGVCLYIIASRLRLLKVAESIIRTYMDSEN